METRRLVAALSTAVVLFGGGITLTGCGDPAGLERRNGTPADTFRDPSGGDPSGVSQGHLPDLSDPKG